MEKITVQELKKEIDAGTSAQIVDVRTPSEYTGERIEQAVSVPLIHFDQLAITGVWINRALFMRCVAADNAPRSFVANWML